MRVLVTGAAGFLGQRLVRKLLNDCVDVRCLVRDSRSAEHLTNILEPCHSEQLSFVQGSLENADACKKACVGCDTIFHVAAAVRGSPAVLFLNNVIGTQELVKAAANSGVRRFVLVSSLGVYGAGLLHAGDTLDETCPIDPNPHLRDPYSFSKIVQEEVAWKAHQAGEITLVVIRPGVIYGPGRECLTNRVGLRMGNCLVRMGGKQLLPYTFVENCADAIRLAGNCEAAEGQAFNIVDDRLPRACDLLRLYGKHVQPIPVFPIPQWLITPISKVCEWYHHWSRGQLPAILTSYKSAAQWKPLRYANTKAKKLLGWTPNVDFASGLYRTFNSLRDQKNNAQPAAN